VSASARVVELEITPEDLAKAQADFDKKPISCSCLIFHAAQRHGLGPRLVAVRALLTFAHERFEISSAGREITEAPSEEWPQFVGRKFTLTQTPPQTPEGEVL